MILLGSSGVSSMNSVGSSLKQSTVRTRRLLVAGTLTAGAALTARLLPAPQVRDGLRGYAAPFCRIPAAPLVAQSAVDVLDDLVALFDQAVSAREAGPAAR